MACLLLASPALSRAAPEEIQVYLDDLTALGRFGLDVHNNYVFSGSSMPAYEGAQPPAHVYRLTPEFYYGLSETTELGLYVLSTMPAQEDPHFDGAKLRFKFIAPHDTDNGSFWGANVELGDTSRRVSEGPWNAELKGIYGYRSGRWLLAVNPNLDRRIGSQPWTLEVDFKAAYSVSPRLQIGLESYNELGPLSDLGHLGQQSQTLYAVVDTELGGFDLNLGLGRGLTDASDRWIVKLILGHHF